jgi:hypothetical protein
MERELVLSAVQAHMVILPFPSLFVVVNQTCGDEHTTVSSSGHGVDAYSLVAEILISFFSHPDVAVMYKQFSSVVDEIDDQYKRLDLCLMDEVSYFSFFVWCLNRYVRGLLCCLRAPERSVYVHDLQYSDVRFCGPYRQMCISRLIALQGLSPGVVFESVGAYASYLRIFFLSYRSIVN